MKQATSWQENSKQPASYEIQYPLQTRTRFMWLIGRTIVRPLSSYVICFCYRYLKRNSAPLGPFHMGVIVAGDWPASDRECMASSEGFHKVDCLRKVSSQQNDCRFPLPSLEHT